MRLHLATFARDEPTHPDISEDELSELLREEGANLSNNPELANVVLAFLQSTDSVKIRKAAALALLDAHYPHLENVINGLLTRPELAKVAGTLIFCLMESGSRIFPDAILNIVRNGSYEARSELLILTSDGLVRAESEAEMDRLRHQLAGAISEGSKEAAEVAALALEDLQA
jgi:hypothetical protein